MKNWQLDLLDKLRAALPLVGVAGLAGFTWWLVQSTPQATGPARPAQASSAPDYELAEARVERYGPQGQILGVLEGKSMRHYAEGDRLEIDAVRLAARDEKGQHLHGVAREGQADGVTKTVVLHGGARVVATPASGVQMAGRRVDQSPVVFEGEILRVQTKEQIVSSELPVKVTHSQGQLQGGTMRHDQRTGITELGRGVRGHYNPPPR